jgi:hypothetical protein
LHCPHSLIRILLEVSRLDVIRRRNGQLVVPQRDIKIKNRLEQRSASLTCSLFFGNARAILDCQCFPSEVLEIGCVDVQPLSLHPRIDDLHLWADQKNACFPINCVEEFLDWVELALD